MQRELLFDKFLAGLFSSTSIICTDKTGTLTNGKPVVTDIILNKKAKIKNKKYGTDLDILDDISSPELVAGLHIGQFCPV